MSGLSIKKVNKRHYIVDEIGNKIYTPPNFIHLRSRDDLTLLMVDLEQGRPYIDAVISWETFMRPVKK